MRQLMVKVMLLAIISVASAQTNNPLFPVSLHIPIAPTPFKGNNRLHLVYELHMTNFRVGDTRLTRLDVLDSDRGDQVLASYKDTELPALLGRPGTGPDIADKRLLGAGMRAIAYLWLTIDAPEAPVHLRHKLVFKTSAGGEDRVVEGAPVTVRKDGPVVIGPPFRGSGWVARNSSNSSFHRRGLMVVNGSAVIAQRFAIDWGKYDENGKAARGDGSKNADYYCYGEEILAVADAVVVGVKDGIPENDPLSSIPVVPVTIDTAAGNSVALDLGNNHFAFYAHLQPGSIRVKIGDRVRRGQVLGLLGNSGNAIGPHLHFHMTDSNSLFGSEGIPYVINSFELLGIESAQAAQKGEWRPEPNTKVEQHRMEMPLDSSVVRFP